ncbi:MAG: hypothetical protein ACPGRX_00075 [Bdellovibrionales bacterium]
MSESAFPPFPPLLQASSAPVSAVGGPVLRADVLTLPPAVEAHIKQAAQQSPRLTGVLTQLDAQQTLSIRTEYGDLRVKLDQALRDLSVKIAVGTRLSLAFVPDKSGAAQLPSVFISVIGAQQPPALPTPPALRSSATPVNLDVALDVAGLPSTPQATASAKDGSVLQFSQAQGLARSAPLIRIEPISPEQLRQLTASAPQAPVQRLETALQPPALAQSIQAGAAPATAAIQTPSSPPASLNTLSFTPQAPVVNIAPPPATQPQSASIPATPIRNNALPPLAPPSQGQITTATLPRTETAASPPPPVYARFHAIAPGPVAITPPDARPIAQQPAPLIGQGQGQAQAGQAQGVVIAHTPNTLPIVQIIPQNTAAPATPPPQNFIIHHPGDALPKGSVLTFSTPISLAAAPLDNALPAPHAPLQPWPVLQGIYEHLAHAAPEVAQQIASIVPNPASPAKFGPATLFFVAALRGGDVTQWLGDKAVDVLRKTDRGAGLLARLLQDSGTLSRIAAEPVHQDWRAVNIPVIWQEQIQKAAIHYKHDQPASGEDTQSGGGTRFVFDLRYDTIGAIQLDGLFQKSGTGDDAPARLDAILRSEHAFSATMHAEMRRIYADALRGSGLSGELSFQHDPAQWVTIKAQSQRFEVRG